MWLRVSALAGALREVEPGPHGPVAATLLPNGTDALTSTQLPPLLPLREALRQMAPVRSISLQPPS
jgi:hypothetical protein